jgi:putative transposase
LNRQLARKQKGSGNWKKVKRQLVLAHEKVANQRCDAHFKLAHQLCDDYDVLGFEDLNLSGMKKLWGRQVSDLGFAQFVSIVQHVAHLRGTQVVQIGRWEPTSQTCSGCGQRQAIALALDERGFTCAASGWAMDRDCNAARNIKREVIALLGVGASTPRLEGVSRSLATASLS